MSNLPAMRKTLAAITIGVLGWAGVVIASDASAITASEWLALGIALATALGVYSIPNEPTIDAHVIHIEPAEAPADVAPRRARRRGGGG